MNGLETFWGGLDWSVLTNALFSVIPALICITVHELSHGLVAYKLGDDTAKRMGRLTLNPIKHIDVMGLLMMVLFRFGFAKPVPIDMRKFKSPKRDMAVSALAGPVSNIVLAAIALIALAFSVRALSGLGEAGVLIASMIQDTAYLSVALAVFNILPIPPLDGSKVLFSLLPEESYYKLMRYERYGVILLLALVWTGILSTPLAYATTGILRFVWDLAVRTASLFSM